MSENTVSIQNRTSKYYESKKNYLNMLLSKSDGLVHHHNGILASQILDPPELENDLLALIHESENNLVHHASVYLEDQVGKKGLDAGCGRGGSSLMLIDKLKCRMTGITISPYQASFAEQELKKRGLKERGIFMCMDYMCTCLPSMSFDFIWMCESSEHSPDLVSLFREMERLAKQGAKMVVIAWTFDADHSMARYYVNKVDKSYETNLWSVQDYRKALKDARWSIQQEEDLTEQTLYYWKLRSLSKNATGTESNFIEGYSCRALLYRMFWVKKE